MNTAINTNSEKEILAVKNKYPKYWNSYMITNAIRDDLKKLGYLPVLNFPGIWKISELQAKTNILDLFSTTSLDELATIYLNKSLIPSWAKMNEMTCLNFVNEFETRYQEKIKIDDVKPENATFVDKQVSSEEFWKEKIIPRDFFLAQHLTQDICNIRTRFPHELLKIISGYEKDEMLNMSREHVFDIVKNVLFSPKDYHLWLFSNFNTLPGVRKDNTNANLKYQELLKLERNSQLLLLALHRVKCLKDVALKGETLADKMIYDLNGLPPSDYNNVTQKYGFVIPNFVSQNSYLETYIKEYSRVLKFKNLEKIIPDFTCLIKLREYLNTLTDIEIMKEFGVQFPKFYGRQQLINQVLIFTNQKTFLYFGGKIVYGTIIDNKEVPLRDIIKCNFDYSQYTIPDLERLVGILETFTGVEYIATRNTIKLLKSKIINPLRADDYMRLKRKISKFHDVKLVKDIFYNLHLLGLYIKNKDSVMEKASVIKIKEMLNKINPEIKELILNLRLLFYDALSNGYLYSVDSISDILDGNVKQRDKSRDLILTSELVIREIFDICT